MNGFKLLFGIIEYYNLMLTDKKNKQKKLLNFTNKTQLFQDYKTS